jgi:hypothetical protein
MINENDRTISEVGEIYMSEVGKQISMHFSTVIDLYQTKLKGLVGSNPYGALTDAAEAYESLSAAAERFGFSYLGLYTGDGERHDVVGGPVQVNGEGEFLDAVNGGEQKVTDGADKAGEPYVFLGTAATYPVENGGTSTAVAVGLPMEELSDVLSLDIGNTGLFPYHSRRRHVRREVCRRCGGFLF